MLLGAEINFLHCGNRGVSVWVFVVVGLFVRFVLFFNINRERL